MFLSTGMTWYFIQFFKSMFNTTFNNISVISWQFKSMISILYIFKIKIKKNSPRNLKVESSGEMPK